MDFARYCLIVVTISDDFSFMLHKNDNAAMPAGTNYLLSYSEKSVEKIRSIINYLYSCLLLPNKSLSDFKLKTKLS